MGNLQVKLYLLLAVLFGIVYAAATMAGQMIGIGNFYAYAVMALFFMFIQYLIGPKLVEWMMKVKYIKREDNPRLYQMVEELARTAGIPMPRVGISGLNIPNAFAFGRTSSDGRVCVTQGILHLLDEQELRAVLAHEVSHLKNRDVLFITLLSVVPLILYYLSFNLIFSGRRERSGGTVMLIGIASLLLYFITNLLVLYASRIREYFADKGAVDLGSHPSHLASSLYKLAYGAARLPREELKEAEGMRAFFLNDPARSLREVKELSQIDLDKSGTIDARELQHLRQQEIKASFSDTIMEVLSTHPNMLKRIKALSLYR